MQKKWCVSWQISDIIDNYLGERLGELDLARLLSEIFEVVRKFGVRPPSDLLLVGKSLSTLVSIAAELKPDWDPVAALKPYLMRYYFKEVANPKTYSRFMGEMTDSYRKLMFNLPNELRQILAKLARGNLTVVVSQQDLHRLTKHHNNLVNRIIGTLVALTFLVLSIVSLQSHSAPAGLGYGLLILSGLLLGAVWLAVRRSGGM
jgi:ubiquinone biosynthesis protein